MSSPALATKFRHVTVKTNYDGHPLSDDEIRCYAPSVFAEEPHFSRSARYAYIPTKDVLTRLRAEGFVPFSVVQARTRSYDRQAHTKHMLRMRHPDHRAAEGEQSEVILVNSHDGSSSYQMLAGLFRFVCCNGLIVGEASNDVRVPHKGDVIGRVIEGAFQVLQESDARRESVDGMKSLTLSYSERAVFAEAAMALRWENSEAAPVKAEQVIQPRRLDDNRADLWTTFNVAQENLVRGGLRGRTQNGKRVETRPISGIDGNVALNRALWVLAEGMRKLKG